MSNLKWTACLSVLALLCVGLGQFAQAQPNLVDQWNRENSQCRGGSGDNPSTLAACSRRDALTKQLSAGGYCFEGPNSAETRWQKCQSSKPNIAQALPGPASGGWFVVMGVPVNSALEFAQPPSPQRAQELERAKRDFAQIAEQTIGKCVAAIVPSQIANDAHTPIDRVNMNLIRVTKRFGPFPDQNAAHDQLVRAGWTTARPSNDAAYRLYHASSGC